MVKTRTLSDAMNMTPEKLAFINGEVTTPKAGKTEKSIDVSLSEEQTGSAGETTHRAPRRSPRRVTQEPPNANQVLDQVLVPVTIRLPHRTAQTLRRAYLEQRLNHAKPDTAQDIVKEALRAWLETAGYLD